MSTAGRDDPPQPWTRTTSGLGMMVFLASDVMLFAAFFAAYFMLRGVAVEWPPAGVELEVARAGGATVALVASSFTLMRADRALLDSAAPRSVRRWLLATVGLGTAFLVNQLLEYSTLSFRADDHPYGSVFWLLTGLHGAHVAAGLAALTMLFVRLVRARDTATVEPFAASVSAYWHLVDVVWIGVFLTIWVIK